MATLPDRLVELAASRPENIALQGSDGCLTYKQLWQTINKLARTLKGLGLKRIGLCGDNSPAWVVADVASLVAGTVCVPVPAFFSQDQTQHLISQARLDALLWTGRSRPSPAACELSESVWLEILPAPKTAIPLPADTAKITFTSGSTGQPKGVCLSLKQLTCTVNALAEKLSDLHLNDHLCVLPLATLLENIAGVYLPLMLGARIQVPSLAQLGLSGSSGLDVSSLVSAINEAKPQSMILVPELARVLVSAAEQNQLRAEGFRFLAVGGGKVAPGLVARGRDVGLPLYEGYGLSECGSVVALNSPAADRPGTVGKPLSHVDVSADSNGQILVSGNTHLGYLGDDGRPQGELATGDIGAIDVDGFLSVSGRQKNLLITGFGRNISPEWLESELVQSTGALQALVFGDGEPSPSALLTFVGHQSLHEVSAALQALNQRLPDYAQFRAVFCRFEPFTQRNGYLTGNGRLKRAHLLKDLQQLLASSTGVLSIDHATTSINPMFSTKRGTPMTFFDTLQADTADARAHVMNAPVLTAIAEGRFDLNSYTWFLTQAYHHVKHTVPLMMSCGGRLPDHLEFVRKALVEYIDEEYGHQEWILNDLAACGENKESIRNGQPDASIELMVAYLYDQIHRGNPAAFFGMVQVLEGTSIELATPMGEKIQKQLGLPDRAFSYLYSHGALDQDHFVFFRDLMNTITHPADQQAIIESARMVYRLYGDMLWSIPLPTSKEDERHEAA